MALMQGAQVSAPSSSTKPVLGKEMDAATAARVAKMQEARAKKQAAVERLRALFAKVEASGYKFTDAEKADIKLVTEPTTKQSTGEGRADIFLKLFPNPQVGQKVTNLEVLQKVGMFNPGYLVRWAKNGRVLERFTDPTDPLKSGFIIKSLTK